jgi:glycerol-3-phosphate acyltransferase PlsY
MILALLVIVSFLIGSIPVGLLVARSKGVDIRNLGSGNIGATNVMRTVGKREALTTLLGDIIKGIIPVLIAWKLFPDNIRIGIVGLAAIAGHNFSIFLKFRGGKGVATSLGVLLAFSPISALFTIAVWISVFSITKISSLSALFAFILLPLNIYLIDNSEGKFLISLIITFLIMIKHKDNIIRLMHGDESRIGQKA